MSINSDIALIRARFKEGFSVNDVEVIYDNAPAKKPDETKPYVFFSVAPNGATEQTIGQDGFMAHTGFVSLKVVAPKGRLTDPTYDIVEQFTDLFTQWRSPVYDIHTDVPVIRQQPDDKAHVVIVFVKYTSHR